MNSSRESVKIERMRRALNELQVIANQFSIDLPIPEVVVVGDQSVGKSSVLQAFVGFQFNFTKSKIATRRPLVLQCENHPSYDVPEWCDLETNLKYSTDEVSRLLERENAAVTEIVDFGIQVKPILLRLKSSQCWNVSLIDLPGLRANDGLEKEGVSDFISSLVGKYLSDRVSDRILLFVESAKLDDFAKSTGFRFVRENAPGWEDRTLVALNMLDLCLSEPSRQSCEAIELFLSDAGEYLTSLGQRRFYTSMPCEVDLNDRKVSWKDILLEKERRDIEILKKFSVDESLSSMVGFSRLARHLISMLNRRYCEAMPQLREKVTAALREKENRLRSVASSLESFRSNRLMYSVAACTNAVVAQLIHLLEGGDSLLFSKYALSLEEEYAIFLKQDPNGRIEYDPLFEPVFRLSSARLLGGGQYRRLMEVIEVALRCKEADVINESVVLNFWLQLQSSHDAHNWMDVVTKLVLEETQVKLRPPLGKVVSHASFIVCRLFDIALETVTLDEHRIFLESSPSFRNALRSHFANFVRGKLSFLEKHLEQYLDACASSVQEWRDRGVVVVENVESPPKMKAAPQSTASQLGIPLPAQTYARVMAAMGRDALSGGQQGLPEQLAFSDQKYSPQNVQKAQAQVLLYFGSIRDRFADNIVLLFDAFCKNPLFSELRIDGLRIDFSPEDILLMFGDRIPELEQEQSSLQKEVESLQRGVNMLSE